MRQTAGRSRQRRYRSTKIMVAESLVRAIAGFFTRDRLGEHAAWQLEQRDLAHGFDWIGDLADWLAQQPSPLDLKSLVQPLARWFSAAAIAAAPA